MTFQEDLDRLPADVRPLVFRHWFQSTFVRTPVRTSRYSNSSNNLRISIKSNCSQSADTITEILANHMKQLRWFQTNWCLPKTIRFSLESFVTFDNTSYARYADWVRYLCRHFRPHEIRITIAVPIFQRVPRVLQPLVWQEYIQFISTITIHWTVNAYVTALYHSHLVH